MKGSQNAFIGREYLPKGVLEFSSLNAHTIEASGLAAMAKRDGKLGSTCQQTISIPTLLLMCSRLHVDINN
jgi:hypothetical protein